ncbi:hypothetical protein [Pedobacter hartonius]|uniref:hypothetical protein n=1 Tax=Pedobacter hartonius TaxID=425514 RepID=UPI001FDF3DA8|nr:hypothetical protein [Pedobacter hartonius]
MGKITAAESLQLQLHLTGCSICRTYQKQSTLISRLFTGFQSNELRLDAEFKLQLQQRIEKEMNKN